MTFARIGLRFAALAVLISSKLCANASAASAVFARIALDQRAGLPGSLVTGTGENFDHWSIEAAPNRIPSERDLEGFWTNPGPVRIHWNAVDRGVLWEGSPGLDGAVSFRFRVPADVPPRDYSVVATQTGYDGKPSGGTPARVTFTVLPPDIAQAPRVRSGLPAATRRGDAGRAAERGPRPAAVSRTPAASASGPVADSRPELAMRRPAVPRSPRSIESTDVSVARPADVRVADGRARVGEREGLDWYVIALAAFAAGVAGGAGGAFALARRKRPAPHDLRSGLTLDPHDPLELELQALLVEQEAREADRASRA